MVGHDDNLERFAGLFGGAQNLIRRLQPGHPAADNNFVVNLCVRSICGIRKPIVQWSFFIALVIYKFGHCILLL